MTVRYIGFQIDSNTLIHCRTLAGGEVCSHKTQNMDTENYTHPLQRPLQDSGRENSMGLQRVGQDWVTFTFFFFHFHCRYWWPFENLISWKCIHRRLDLVMCVCVYSLSRVWLCNPVDCIAHQAPLSTEFSRQEYWSGLPFPPPGGLLNPGIEPWSPALQADLPTKPSGKPQPLWHFLLK